MQILKEKLLNILTDKPQSRKVLASKLNTSDRRLRILVSDLRKEGHCIIADKKYGGYYLGSQIDYLKEAAKYRKRGITFMQMANEIEKNVQKNNWRLKA